MLNWGVDFRGGSEIVLEFSKPVDAGEIRKTLTDVRARRRRRREVRRPDGQEAVELHDPRRPPSRSSPSSRPSRSRSRWRTKAAPTSRSSSGRRAATRSTCATTSRSSRRRWRTRSRRIGVNTNQVQTFGRAEENTYEVTLVGLDTEIRHALDAKLGAGAVAAIPLGRVGRRQGRQAAAVRRRQIAALRDPAHHGLHRVPLRLPLRPGHGRRAAARRGDRRRRVRRDLQGVLAHHGGGRLDDHRLLDERHHRRLRPHPRERDAPARPALRPGRQPVDQRDARRAPSGPARRSSS